MAASLRLTIAALPSSILERFIILTYQYFVPPEIWSDVESVASVFCIRRKQREVMTSATLFLSVRNLISFFLSYFPSVVVFDGR